MAKVSVKPSEESVDTSSKANKDTAFKLAWDNIEKTYGKGAVVKLGDTPLVDLPVIPSGCLSLDMALGVRGYPKGRIVEVFGPEASGKTTMCLHAIAEAQKQGGRAVFVDVENALDMKYAKALGVNVTDLTLSQPECGEDALGIVEVFVRSGAVDIVVVDSVAALVPRAEIEGEMGDATMGVQARLMSQAMRKLTTIVSKTQTTVMFTNQLRQKIGVVYGNPETTTGGNALKYYASVRLDVRRIETLKGDGGAFIGSKTRIKVVKNKVAPPFRETIVDVIYGKGIDHIGDLVDLAVDCDVVNKSGSWFSYKNDKLGQGRDAVKAWVGAMTTDIFNEFKNEVIAKYVYKT